VSIRDNGVGIDADMLPRLFEMFTRAVTPLEHARGGLGIGLAISRRLVEMHGGTIVVHSPPLDSSVAGSVRRGGKGCEFIVRLPAAPPLVHPERAQERADVAASVPVSGPPAGAALRILVADDNADAAESIAMLLEEEGHDVRMVHDGKAAVDAMGVFHPHLALLDIGMPRLNGYQVAQRARSEPWGRDMFLVALTGWGQAEDRRKSSEARFDRHIVKPITLAALEEVLMDARARTRETTHGASGFEMDEPGA
jgi:CheY-like chemotaxis protein